MQKIDLFTLIDSHRKKNGKMLISKTGTPISVDVDGLMIDEQFELNNGNYLIWLTDDSPYDEMLHIYLINSKGDIEDAVEAGARLGMGPGGVLRIKSLGKSRVDFNFFSGIEIYRLEILMQKQRFRRLPNCWRYKNRFIKHTLSITEVGRKDELCQTSP